MLAKLICRVFGHKWVYGFVDRHFMYNERCCSRCTEWQDIPKGDPYYRHFVSKEDRKWCTMSVTEEQYRELEKFLNAH